MSRHLTVAELNARPFAITVNVNTRVLIGDRVYLVAKTKTAPTAAYDEPPCTLVQASNREPLVTVRLDDGTQITTSGENIRHRRPERRERTPKLRVLPGRNKHIDPKHGEELSLLDELGGEGA